ncbi:MAG: hypothetical protein DWQ07_08285 [Chloroflexi bacterium]|nr:MAG: hypothetical protein DWQ07_08285 [Chloroflexota bacterium]MBL1193291.1 hypothetical protein [Chloroflexota bacterium]NOH10583.1 hypothetical protein [Chloroflexota bacterium]
MRNIYSSLNRYATRQEENFLTEAFAHLLELLIEQEPDSASSLLEKIFDLEIGETASALHIETQKSFEDGTPDLIISNKDTVVFIEIKHDSQLGHAQLERYLSRLSTLDFRRKQLVLLTRSKHAIQQTSLSAAQFHHICWYQISGWLSELDFVDEVSNYHVDSFIRFLGEKGMNMEKVEWEYIRGVPAMRNLVNMIGTAISEALPEANSRRNAGWDWIGYIIEDKLWLGIQYDEALSVMINNYGEQSATFIETMDLEDAHFFALSPGEQLEILISFIKENAEKFNSIEN